MQTITTKYLSATHLRDARMKATHTGGYTSVTESYDYALNNEDNHIVVAHMLAQKLGWDSTYVGGHTKEGMVFVDAKPVYSFTTVKSKAPDSDKVSPSDQVENFLFGEVQ